jgi:DNA-binding NtrC family response regulator
MAQHRGAAPDLQPRGQESAAEEQVAEEAPHITFSGRFPQLREVEELLIEAAMERAQGNQTVAASLLGISQSTLSRRFAKKNG